MKINEIIVESRGQINEGMMDTIKSKLSQVYQMARKKYPNFDEVLAAVKTHKKELMDIRELLKSKKENGTLSKEDIMSAVIPLVKKVRGEVNIENTITNEGFSDLKQPIMHLLALFFAIPAGFLHSSSVGFTTYMVIMGIFVAACAIDEVIDGPEPQKSTFQRWQEEYDALEQRYKNNRHEMSYADTRRMEELYNKGYR